MSFHVISQAEFEFIWKILLLITTFWGEVGGSSFHYTQYITSWTEGTQTGKDVLILWRL